MTRGHTGSGANRVFFPRIKAIVGSAARSFAYDRTEGGNRAIFAYTVKRGDADADGIELCPNTDSRCTGTIDLGSGSNRGAIVAFDDGTDASHVYTIPPVWADHKVAARARPGISGVAVTATPAEVGGDTFKRDERIEATVTFDEPVSVTGAAGAGNGIVLKVQFRSGSGTNDTKDFGYLRQPSARTLVFGYTVASGDEDDDGLCFGASCAADDLVLQGSAAIAAELDGEAAGLGHAAFETEWKVDGDQAGLTGGVCGRSIPVRDALVAATAGADDCSDVSTTRLGLIATLDMSGKGLAELQAGDLDGLTALTGLDLSDNALTGLPAALFDDLVALSTLDLGDNALGSLPAGILLPLHATLTQLNLGGNPLGSLGGATFSGLAALVVLDLEHAGLTSLPASIFQDLAALRDLDLKGNAFTTLPATVFRGRSALAELDLERSGLASLPADVFQGLGALVDLDLHDNDLAALAAGLFDGAAALTTLDISGNALAALPDAIFQPLTALDSLDFSDNPGVDDFVPAFTVSGAERVRAQGAVELVAAVEGNPWGSNLAAWAWTRTDSEAVTLSLAGADTPTLGFEAPSLAADAEIVFEVTATARGNTASAAADWTVAIASTASIAGFAVTSRAVEGGTYRQGETIELTASFTERVFVNGAPALEIRVGAGNGGPRRDAAYRSGTGTAELVFAYTVHPSDSDSDGVHVGANALALEGGTVRNALGENAVLGFAAPGRFTGVVVAGGTLPATGGICDRTREVREELVALSALATSCADMGAAELAALPVSLELHSLGIVALKPGDFAGLGQVVVLDLSANALTEVTPGVLDPLTALIQLGLVGNKIARVPAAVFDPLTELTQLGFSNNRIATLLPGTFDRLTKLRSLDLSDNQLAAFPDRIFEPLTELTDVSLTGNPGSADFKPAAAARVVDGTALVWQGVELEIDGSASEGGAWGSNLLYAWELDGVPGQVAMFDDASAASTTVRFVEMSGMGGSTGLKLVVRGRGGALTSSERIPLSVQRQPAVTSIAFSSLPRIGGGLNTPYRQGEAIEVTATYSEAVTVTGQPHVGILLGASHDENDYRPAVWRRTVEGRKLVFAYEVVSADDFGEGISVCTGPNALGCAGHRIELPAGASIVAASDGLPAKLDYAAGGAPEHDYGVAGGTAALTGGICDRTPQVRDAIVEKISQFEGDPWNCSEVEADGILAELADDGEEFTLDLSDAGIASLKAGDFAGILAYRLDLSGNALTNLSREMLPDKVSDRLDLSGNALTQIPAGLIRGLGVEKVDFSGNAIAHVAREGFAGGGAMTQLDLSDNRIATLPDGVFEELTGLTALDLDGNAGTASFVPALAIEVPDLAERVYAGQTVTLRGSSSGPWGTNVSYAWTNDAGNTPQLALTGASLAAASFEAPTRSAPTIYRFHLVVTGRGGSGYAVSDVLEVNVQKQPYVLSAAVTSRPRTQSGANADTYGAGEAIEITVGVNEPVEVTGAPHIKIQVGTARRSAVYVRHASPSQLVFAKTMSASDADTDGFGVHSTAIELGTNDRIRNRHGAAAASYPLVTVTGPKDKVKGSFTAPSGGICGRSGAVAAALLARVKANDSSVAGCADVTAAHLAALSGTLTFTSSALDAGDFAGLDRIAGLDLGGGGLVALPAGVFDPLASLTALKLHDNALRVAPGRDLRRASRARDAPARRQRRPQLGSRRDLRAAESAGDAADRRPGRAVRAGGGRKRGGRLGDAGADVRARRDGEHAGALGLERELRLGAGGRTGGGARAELADGRRDAAPERDGAAGHARGHGPVPPEPERAGTGPASGTGGLVHVLGDGGGGDHGRAGGGLGGGGLAPAGGRHLPRGRDDRGGAHLQRAGDGDGDAGDRPAGGRDVLGGRAGGGVHAYDGRAHAGVRLHRGGGRPRPGRDRHLPDAARVPGDVLDRGGARCGRLGDRGGRERRGDGGSRRSGSSPATGWTARRRR